MAESPPVSFRLQRPDGPLPSQEDFGFGLEQTYAWKDFGNLTLSEAWEHFIVVPESYQERFMRMGSVAFAYYFPVIDKYLREYRPEFELGDICCAWILGCDVRMQFQWSDGHKPLPQVVDEIRDLSAFVQANVDRYSEEPEEQERIKESWRAVDAEVALCAGA